MTDRELIIKLCDYILNQDCELEDYEQWCKENKLDLNKNNSGHIVGVARRLLDRMYEDNNRR